LEEERRRKEEEEKRLEKEEKRKRKEEERKWKEEEKKSKDENDKKIHHEKSLLRFRNESQQPSSIGNAKGGNDNSSNGSLTPNLSDSIRSTSSNQTRTQISTNTVINDQVISNGNGTSSIEEEVAQIGVQSTLGETENTFSSGGLPTYSLLAHSLKKKKAVAAAEMSITKTDPNSLKLTIGTEEKHQPKEKLSHSISIDSKSGKKEKSNKHEKDRVGFSALASDTTTNTVGKSSKEDKYLDSEKLKLSSLRRRFRASFGSSIKEKNFDSTLSQQPPT